MMAGKFGDHSYSVVLDITFPFLYPPVIVQEPQTTLLGLERQWKGSGSKRSYREVREEMMYIPILKTIQVLLNNPEVAKQVIPK